MTDAYAETDVWPNPPATPTPGPDRTESAPDASRVLGDAPTATDAREALLRAERDTYRKQWHQEVENFERETVRAEAAEARLRAVEAEARKGLDGDGRNDGWLALQAILNILAVASAAPAESDANGCYGDTPLCEAHRSPWDGRGRCHAVSDGEGATSEACPTCGKARDDQTPGPHKEGWGVCPESFHFRPASPAVARSATEAPQAPAEQEGLRLPPRPTVHDGTGPVDGVTRCCGVRMTDLSLIDRVVTGFESQVTCSAPSPRPDTADDEGVRRG